MVNDRFINRPAIWLKAGKTIEALLYPRPFLQMTRRLTMARFSRTSYLSAVLLCCAIFATDANAQPMFGGSMMMGPHVIGPGFDRMCGPGPAGFVEWRLERLAPTLKISDAQRATFDELKSVSGKSADTLRSACATSVAPTISGRMEAMEKRMEAMLAASKAIRPALDAFYASLTDEQKAQLDSGRHRFWRWRDHWMN